jgi:hypothetical protein
MSEAAIAKKSKRQARERTCILGRIRPYPAKRYSISTFAPPTEA